MMRAPEIRGVLEEIDVGVREVWLDSAVADCQHWHRKNCQSDHLSSEAKIDNNSA